MTTQVKAIDGKASTAIPAAGVYANDIVPPHDPGSSGSANLLPRTGEAKAALEDIRRLKKDLSLDEFAASQPFRDPKVLSRLLDELRAGGLK